MIFWGEEREGARDAEDEVPKCGEHPRRARLAQAHVRELTAQWALGGRARRVGRRVPAAESRPPRVPGSA
jgi:hypothetical protein